MHSRARLTYTQVWRVAVAPKSATSADAKALLPHLDQPLRASSRRCCRARETRGAIDFDTVELADRVRRRGQASTQIVPVAAQRRAPADRGMHARGERLRRGLPRRASSSRRSTASTKGRRPTSSPRCASSSRARRCRSAAATSRTAPRLREAARADRATGPTSRCCRRCCCARCRRRSTSRDNVGHFGLAFEAYAHFTSPIRRYPDLLVHRAIKARARRQARTRPRARSWEALGVHCSITERRADDATRDVDALAQVLLHAGPRSATSSTGTISGVTSFGLFVSSTASHIDGLVHVTALGRDYFHFDAGAPCADRRAAAAGMFQLAGRVRVKVARVDLGDGEDRLHARGRRGARSAAPAVQRAAVTRACRREEEAALGRRRRAPHPALFPAGREGDASALALGLRRHPQIRPQRLVALRELLP